MSSAPRAADRSAGVSRRSGPLSDPAAGSWQDASSDLGLCGQRHGGAPGSVDESARRLSHEELAVAVQLAGEGHAVRSVAERRGQGPTADLDVCGAPVEVKSWLALGERDGKPPSPRSVLNKLLAGGQQSATVVLYGRGSGLTPTTARRGVELYAACPSGGRLSRVRVLGDGFDLAWGQAQGLQLAQPARARAVARERSVAADHAIGLG